MTSSTHTPQGMPLMPNNASACHDLAIKAQDIIDKVRGKLTLDNKEYAKEMITRTTGDENLYLTVTGLASACHKEILGEVLRDALAGKPANLASTIGAGAIVALCRFYLMIQQQELHHRKETVPA